MDELPVNATKRHYRWPWFVLAALLLQAVIVLIWVSMAARHVEQQRDFSAPPSGVHH